MPVIAAIGGGIALLIVTALIAIPLLTGDDQTQGAQTATTDASNAAAPARRDTSLPAEKPMPPQAVQPSESEPATPSKPPVPSGNTEPVEQTPAETIPDDEQTAEPPAETPPPPTSKGIKPEPSPDPPSQEVALQTDEKKRTKVPDTESLEKAREAVREIYAAQFSAAKLPEQKSKLAGEMLRQAQVPFDDSAGKYALLDTARRIAEQAGDLRLTLRACDQLAESFDIMVMPLKESALDACRKTARQSSELQQLASQSLAVAEEAVKIGDYAAAQRLATAAGEVARKSRDKELIALVTDSSKEITRLAVTYEQANDAFERLRTDPKDATSHLVVGKFLCFEKGDWESGLPHLAQGSDVQLAELAKEDQEGANKDQKLEEEEPEGASRSEAWAALGDGWLRYSKSAKEEEQTRATVRAAFWYRKALPTLTGLNRVKVEKTLEVVTKSISLASAEPAPPSTTTLPKRNTTPSIPPELKMIGTWKVTYSSEAVRKYQFDGRGNVFFVENKQLGHLVKRGDDILIDFDDGKIERLQVVEGGVLIEHFDPASRYPDGPSNKARAEPSMR